MCEYTRDQKIIYTVKAVIKYFVSQGICPGNRLRLIAGVYDSGQKPNDEFALTVPHSQQQHGKRRSWQTHSNKVTCINFHFCSSRSKYFFFFHW